MVLISDLRLNFKWVFFITKFQIFIIFKGRKPITLEEKRKLGGGYNASLQTSLPAEYRLYDPKQETAETSNKLFTSTFPHGFALEIVQVYTGPPLIVYKFRHWAYMEGPYKGHAPTGELIELYGTGIFEVKMQTSFDFSSEY